MRKKSPTPDLITLAFMVKGHPSWSSPSRSLYAAPSRKPTPIHRVAPMPWTHPDSLHTSFSPSSFKVASLVIHLGTVMDLWDTHPTAEEKIQVPLSFHLCELCRCAGLCDQRIHYDQPVIPQIGDIVFGGGYLI